MLARILAVRHGFKCTVLFAIDPETGIIYSTDSQGARALPSFADPDAPELPFTCDLDGIVYEPEPWKLARQQRLKRYARQRDHIAGIVVYDGEWKEEAETPSEADPHPQAIEASQATIFPEEFDQRPPEEWQERQWDPTSQQWQGTPLPQWATEANSWDGADPKLPEDEPVFYND